MQPSPEFCFLWVDWWPLCMTKAEWSGWVQAIGSILAIAWAARLLRVQLRITREHAIEAEQRRLRRRHNAIMAVALFAEKVVRICCTAASMQCQTEGALDWRSDVDALNMARDELQGLRASGLESFHLVRAIRRLAVCVDNATRIDAALTEGLGYDAAAFRRTDVEAQRTAEQAQAALKEIESAVTELMEDPEIAVPPLSF